MADIGGEGDEVQRWEFQVEGGMEGLETSPCCPVGRECGWRNTLYDVVSGDDLKVAEWMY